MSSYIVSGHPLSAISLFNELICCLIFLICRLNSFLWTHMLFDLAVSLNGLLLEKYMWKDVCIPFYLFSCCNKQFAGKICTNYSKRSSFLNYVWRRNALLFFREWFGMESFLFQAFSDSSFLHFVAVYDFGVILIFSLIAAIFLYDSPYMVLLWVSLVIFTASNNFPGIYIRW